MYEAYAIIYTTFHVIGALLVIGFACWIGGKIRARVLWDLEDEICDLEEECICNAHQRARIAMFPKLRGEFDFSDVREESNGEKQIRSYDDRVVFRPTEGTWLYPVSRMQRLRNEPEARRELPEV